MGGIELTDEGLERDFGVWISADINAHNITA